MLNGHGDDILKDVKFNFSSNVYYGGIDPALAAHLARSLHLIGRYPEVSAQSLQEQIAGFHGLLPTQALVVNGAVEAIYLLAQAYNGVATTLFYPSFREYEDACTLNNHRITYREAEVIRCGRKIESELVFICNPNNPTGRAIASKTMFELIRDNPQTVFIIDEVYRAFTHIQTTCVPFLQEFKNLIIIKSLTKQFAIPGLRLGYILSSPGVIEKILAYKMPWSVNALALEAGRFIFEHLHHNTFSIDNLLEETVWLQGAVSSLESFGVFSSDTSFFLATTQFGDARQLKHFLLRNFGILIRDASNFRGLSKEHFRLSTQNHSDNLVLIEALKQWTLQHSK